MWSAVEADFLRDYQIDLVEQIDRISWRRFLVLLNNLSPKGAVAVQLLAKHNDDDSTPEDDKAAADAFFAQVVSM